MMSAFSVIASEIVRCAASRLSREGGFTGVPAGARAASFRSTHIYVHVLSRQMLCGGFSGRGQPELLTGLFHASQAKRSRRRWYCVTAVRCLIFRPTTVLCRFLILHGAYPLHNPHLQNSCLPLYRGVPICRITAAVLCAASRLSADVLHMAVPAGARAVPTVSRLSSDTKVILNICERIITV